MEQKSNKKIWQTVAIILGMLAFGALGFYCGSQDTFNISNKKQKTHTTIDSKEQTIDVSGEEKESNKTPDEEYMEKVVNKLLSDISLRNIVDFHQTGNVDDSIKMLYVLDALEDKYVEAPDDENCRLGYTNEKDVQEAYNNYFTGDYSTETSFPYYYEDGKFYKGSCGGFVFVANLIKSSYEFTQKDDKYFVDFYLGYADMDYMNIYSDPELKNTMKSTNHNNEFEGYVLKADEVSGYDHYTAVFEKNDSGKLVFDKFELSK